MLSPYSVPRQVINIDLVFSNSSANSFIFSLIIKYICLQNNQYYIYQCFMMRILVAFMIVGLCLGSNWTQVDQAVQNAISNGHFSGCEIGVFSDSATLFKRAYGTLTPTLGLYAPAVTSSMTYDINYLTQVIGVNSVLMQMYDQAQLNVTDRVSRHFFDFDNNGKRYITIQNVMIHNSGLQATYTDAYPSSPSDLSKKINNLKLEYKTESKFEYSELGYYVLGEMVAKMAGVPLDQAISDVLIFSGLRNTTYHPANHSVAPSGYNNGIVWGKPTNKLANFMKNATGHAGMFSTVDEMGKYMQLMLNKGRTPPYSRTFSEEVINLFTTKVNIKGYNSTRALGWDTVPKTNPPCGHKFSQNSFGLTDPTGSYVWADKKNNVTIVLLANGQFPIGKNDHSEAQGTISDAVMTALGF